MGRESLLAIYRTREMDCSGKGELRRAPVMIFLGRATCNDDRQAQRMCDRALVLRCLPVRRIDDDAGRMVANPRRMQQSVCLGGCGCE